MTEAGNLVADMHGLLHPGEHLLTCTKFEIRVSNGWTTHGEKFGMLWFEPAGKKKILWTYMPSLEVHHYWASKLDLPLPEEGIEWTESNKGFKSPVGRVFKAKVSITEFKSEYFNRINRLELPNDPN